MAGSSTSELLRPPEAQPGAPLVVSRDERLLDDLLRLCAAAGVQPAVAEGTTAREPGWERPPLVLVGDDAAAGLVGTAPRRPAVVLVGRDPDDAGIWRRAVAIGAEHVALLPDAETWLVDRIADATEGSGGQAVTVGVVGGRGGAGASTLACALAVTAARSGRRTVLVDGDPLGGGLDVLLGGESAEGLRWPAFARSSGRVAGGALEESLPALHSLRLLSWDRGEAVVVRPEAARSVLAAARRRDGVVVVDLPRRMDGAAAEALAQLDMGLLVVPAELRAVAAAQRISSALRMVLRDLRVVVRGSPTSGLRGEEIARLLGLPLVGELPSESGLARLVERGAVPGSHGDGPLARFCGLFWDRALADVGGRG
ncbi:septum site-determining protein Ssd [Streptomyces sp. TP-A0874]|uniref:septum site-determining protein Ssd n=1 Tax=Streptomyces sp. TP-A0874 TaxID=549819 RepID=UPI000853DDE4|nr:septum site-determining protein Ssd [Streptomyces sp. TP-A0874]